MEEDLPGIARPATPAIADARSQRWPTDPEEFSTLVEKYLDRLHRYAVRRLGHAQDAEDVVQEVFVRAYQGLDTRRNVAHVGAYLYRMTANACSDMLRSRQREFARGAALPLETAPDGGAGPSEAARAAEEALRVEQLLRRLPKAQAEAVRLRVFGELSLNEIAEASRCSINTANSRLRYGFKKLRRIVAREWTP